MMRPSPLLQLIQGVDQITASDAIDAANQFKRLINDIAARHGVHDVARLERIEFTRRLLAADVSRPTIRDRLIARYDLGAKQAYRIIGAALKLRHFPAPNDTPLNQNNAENGSTT